MRLKSLLVESEEAVARVASLLKNQFRNDLPKLYRATDRDFDGQYTVREIRKGRKPIGGAAGAQLILDFLTQKKYDDVPKRSESKFAAAGNDEGRLNVFGDNEFLVFPDKTADIASFEKDTKRARNDWENALYMVKNDLTRKENGEFYYGTSEKKYDLIGEFFYLVFNEGKEKNLSFLKNNWKDLREEFKKAKKENPGIASEISELINPSYLQMLKKQIELGDSEVVFDGSKYLYVRKHFFDQHFEKRGSKWKSKG